MPARWKKQALFLIGANITAPGIASVIMLTGLFWAPADHIGNNVVRIIVKGVILLIMVLIEFCVLINATLPWLERRENVKPNIRIMK